LKKNLKSFKRKRNKRSVYSSSLIYFPSLSCELWLWLYPIILNIVTIISDSCVFDEKMFYSFSLYLLYFLFKILFFGKDAGKKINTTPFIFILNTYTTDQKRIFTFLGWYNTYSKIALLIGHCEHLPDGKIAFSFSFFCSFFQKLLIR